MKLVGLPQARGVTRWLADVLPHATGWWLVKKGSTEGWAPSNVSDNFCLVAESG